jgi:hypothetical protein
VKNAKVEDYVVRLLFTVNSSSAVWFFFLGVTIICYTSQVGFDQLGGKDDFSTDDLEERIAKAQVIFLDGEGPGNPSKQAATSKRSVRQSDTGNSSDSD